jgi:exopolysaccharide production repressor protein
MSLPVFLRGFICLLGVFAIATYLSTGSGWETFIYTMICAVLTQVGYFVAVLFLIWRSPGTRLSQRGLAVREATEVISKEKQSAPKAGRFQAR